MIKILTSCFFAGACLAGFTVQGACLRLNLDTNLPSVIEKGQCIELQGGNVIKEDLRIDGDLFTKAGTVITIAPDTAITVAGEGRFTLRSGLEAAEGVQIKIEDRASLTLRGESFLQQGMSILLQDQASARLAAPIHLEEGALIKLEDSSSLELVSIVTFNGANLVINSGRALNQGILSFIANSALALSSNAVFVSEGTMTVDENAAFQISGRGSFINSGRLDVYGNLILRAMGSFLNKDRVLISESGSLSCFNNAAAGNTHLFAFAGTALFDNACVFENSGTLEIAGTGILTLKGDSKLNSQGWILPDSQQIILHDNARVWQSDVTTEGRAR